MAGDRIAAREASAHDAVVRMEPDGDDRAPGGAITLALCGSWAHDPPCPLAPHSTRADRTGTEVSLRVLLAASPAGATVRMAARDVAAGPVRAMSAAGRRDRHRAPHARPAERKR